MVACASQHPRSHVRGQNLDCSSPLLIYNGLVLKARIPLNMPNVGACSSSATESRQATWLACTTDRIYPLIFIDFSRPRLFTLAFMTQKVVR